MLLKNGDYIKYDTGITTVGENGIVMFRVLYPMDSEYGLQIISNENLGEFLRGGGGSRGGMSLHNDRNYILL